MTGVLASVEHVPRDLALKKVVRQCFQSEEVGVGLRAKREGVVVVVSGWVEKRKS